MLCKKTLPGFAARELDSIVPMLSVCVYYRKASVHFNHKNTIIYVVIVFLSCRNSALPEKWESAPLEAE